MAAALKAFRHGLRLRNTTGQVPIHMVGPLLWGLWNGLVGGASAASGPLHPAADRPLSRPPGRSHAATGPRQGRFASLRDRWRRPLTLARAARAGVHAAPGAAGVRPAGREHPSPSDSAGIGSAAQVWHQERIGNGAVE
jgi:hypothetical protein